MKYNKAWITSVIILILIIIAGVWYVLRQTGPQTNTFGLPAGGENGVLTPAPLVQENALTTYSVINMSYPRSSADEYPEIWSFVQETKNSFLANGGSPSTEEVAASPSLQQGNRYELDMTTKIATSSQTVSYIISTYEYTGGAHGGTGIATFTYDKNEKLVTLDNLFSGPYLDRLSSASRQYFYDNLAYGQKEMIDSGTDPDIENFKAWYMTDSAIIFIFGQYQIGPYALGIKEFPLTKSEVWDILNPIFK